MRRVDGKALAAGSRPARGATDAGDSQVVRESEAGTAVLARLAHGGLAARGRRYDNRRDAVANRKDERGLGAQVAAGILGNGAKLYGPCTGDFGGDVQVKARAESSPGEVGSGLGEVQLPRSGESDLFGKEVICRLHGYVHGGTWLHRHPVCRRGDGNLGRRAVDDGSGIDGEVPDEACTVGGAVSDGEGRLVLSGRKICRGKIGYAAGVDSCACRHICAVHREHGAGRINAGAVRFVTVACSYGRSRDSEQRRISWRGSKDHRRQRVAVSADDLDLHERPLPAGAFQLNLKLVQLFDGDGFFYQEGLFLEVAFVYDDCTVDPYLAGSDGRILAVSVADPQQRSI